MDLDLRRLQALADDCRWANLGYKGEKPGTVGDIQQRIHILETNTGYYIRSEQTLKERIRCLERKLTRLRKEADEYS